MKHQFVLLIATRALFLISSLEFVVSVLRLTIASFFDDNFDVVKRVLLKIAFCVKVFFVVVEVVGCLRSLLGDRFMDA